MPNVPPPCVSLNDEMIDLKAERTSLQLELQDAPTGRKAALVNQIKHLNALIAAKQPALDHCIAINGGDQPPQAPIAVSLKGTMMLTTNGNFQGEPYSPAVNWSLIFDGERSQGFISSFAVDPFDTTALADQIAGFFKFLFGPNITTITKIAGGNFAYSKAQGAMAVPLSVHVHHSRDTFIFAGGDSDLSLMLMTTNPGGSNVMPNGQLTLVGSGPFTGGVLNGVICTMMIAATLSPMP